MAIPAPVPPTYRDLSGEEAVEAEEDFYWILRLGLLHLYQLCGSGGYRRGGGGSGGGKLLVSYPPGSDAFREFCKAKGAIGGRTWNDNIIWVKGNCLRRDDEELLDLRFRSVKQSVKSTVERKEPLLDEVSEEETELELALGELASGITGSGEVAQGKRKRVEPLGGSGEKVAEEQSVSGDNLKEVEERARSAILQGKEDTNHMVSCLIKGIWLSIEEQESELKKAKSKLEKNLARAKTDALKEVKQLKAAHVVAISQLQVEEEVDAIKADTYAEEEEDEAEVLRVMDGLDGVSPQTVLDNQRDDVVFLVDGSEKIVKETSFRINDLESGLAREIETSKALLSTQTELQVTFEIGCLIFALYQL
ncbi:hypothetical protein GIB67_006444 [Kingdonia uniflora]|uniref:Uncharacterized protein n=1 Tax=Kingdonia uniflora TaxID=39325 RepID=A0A7J7NEU7_9MAGN|nr:hypothetical protein GIB67_006444 [Kingdonia uniflora]